MPPNELIPLAKDELTGPRCEGRRRMIERSAAGRAGAPDELGAVGALLMGEDGGRRRPGPGTVEMTYQREKRTDFPVRDNAYRYYR